MFLTHSPSEYFICNNQVVSDISDENDFKILKHNLTIKNLFIANYNFYNILLYNWFRSMILKQYKYVS